MKCSGVKKYSVTVLKDIFQESVLHQVKLLNYCPPLIVNTLLILFAVISLFFTFPTHS